MRRYEDGGYYPEDYAPYDWDNWTQLLDVIDWLAYPFPLAAAEQMVVGWIASGQLPLAYWYTDLDSGKSTMQAKHGPPPSGPNCFEYIREARQHGRQFSNEALTATPCNPDGTPREGFVPRVIGYSLLVVHCATFGELAREYVAVDASAIAEEIKHGDFGYRVIADQLRGIFGKITDEEMLAEESKRLGRKAGPTDMADLIPSQVWDRLNVSGRDNRRQMTRRALALFERKPKAP